MEAITNGIGPVGVSLSAEGEADHTKPTGPELNPLKVNHRQSDGVVTEMYSDRRFFVVTGDHVAGTPTRIEHRQQELAEVHADIFGQLQLEKASTSRSRMTEVRRGARR